MGVSQFRDRPKRTVRRAETTKSKLLYYLRLANIEKLIGKMGNTYILMEFIDVNRMVGQGELDYFDPNNASLRGQATADEHYYYQSRQPNKPQTTVSTMATFAGSAAFRGSKAHSLLVGYIARSAKSSTLGLGVAGLATTAAAVSAAFPLNISCDNDGGGNINHAGILQTPLTTRCEASSFKRGESSSKLKTRMTSVGRFSIISETAENPRWVSFGALLA